MRKLEMLMKKGFYTMAFIRTLACIILLIIAMCGCGSIERVYTEAYYFQHQLHLEANINGYACFWCREQQID